MRKERKIYGMVAEFVSPEELKHATEIARAEGYRRMDAYSPFPIEGLAELVGFRFNLLSWLVLGGGFSGAILGYFMEWYGMAVSYPINVGGRPLNSWPSFIPVTFECGVLAASLTALIGMCALCGLPQPFHPVMRAVNFDRVTQDRFFLCIQATDPFYDSTETARFFGRLHPREISEVEA